MRSCGHVRTRRKDDSKDCAFEAEEEIVNMIRQAERGGSCMQMHGWLAGWMDGCTFPALTCIGPLVLLGPSMALGS